MSDGSQLRQTWSSALNDAEAQFRALLTSSSASEWKRISSSVDGSPKKGKSRMSSVPELGDVIVHRNSSKAGDDIYRLILDVPTGDESVSLESWKAVLTTPELRQEWDPAVEEAHLLELFDRTTRICKTKFTLGWPANPRDAVTISRSFQDTATLIDISISLPRSSDEPTYLRPSPPYVRSDVKLFAWCIQHVPSTYSPSDDQAKKKSSTVSKIRITCFWQHDLKAMWGFNSTTASLTQQLSTMVLSLLKSVMKRGARVPKLAGYGNGISVNHIRYQIDRAALTIDYSIIPEDDDHSTNEQVLGMDDLQAVRENRRLTRSVECVLPSIEGWDVQVTLRGSSDEVEQLPWSAHAMRIASTSLSPPSSPTPLSPFSLAEQIILRITHAALADEHSVLKVKIVVEVAGGSPGIRLNGLPKAIHEVEERDPSSYIAQNIFQDITSTNDLSFNTASSLNSSASVTSATSITQGVVQPFTERTAAAEKSILSRVRRNYIYFSSLLQEPEAKWRRTTDARGVSITQLDSIDPTLVVYRAEATFVGVGLWDLYGAVASPGARSYWDKQHEDAMLLEDVSELTELWHYKTKPAWPVTGRDAVLLKTVYKSPTTIHVFSFSADDPHLFPHIPLADPNVIRTQVDLQGWAIEALSPTTTMLTLLEQSDPKGWTNKASIPTQMINTLAGIGEFAIKCGGPPVVTRLAGAKANELRYDHEKGSFKVEYEVSTSRQLTKNEESTSPLVECEIRCDIDTWASSLDIVVDPPPQTITCLRRHRLSAEGGGLWLTLGHDSVFVDDERLLTIVRRAPGKEKGLVMVNGAKVQVDVEELPETEIKLLSKKKRVKPLRIPLDQPPVVGVIRRRKAEWGVDQETSDASSPVGTGTSATSWATAPRTSSPLTRLFSYAVDQATTTTQQAVAAISPSNSSGSAALPSPSKHPIQYALEALSWTQEFSTGSSTSSEGWTFVSDKGVSVHRKIVPQISPIIPVHKGSKVIEGVSAEELASVVQEFECRKTWDERFGSVKVLESFGAEARTSFLVSKGGFPFRDRGFYLASVLARGHSSTSNISRRNTGDVSEQSNGRNAIFCVAASFSPDSVASFAPAKYNPYQLPIGRVYVDAWILETLDPYTKENYAIPSTRCTHLVAIDYAGSIPAAVNSMINTTMTRSLLNVETFIKSTASLPLTRLPAPGMVISEPKGFDHLKLVAWKLRKRDENRVFVKSQYATDGKVYNATVLVTIPPSDSSEESTPRLSRTMLSPSPPLRTKVVEPTDQELQPSSLPSSTDSSKGDATATATTPMTSTVPEQRERVMSLSGTVLRDVSMRGRSSGAFTIKGEVRPSTDLLVAELVVDSKLYPDGYDVTLSSRMRSSVRVGVKGQYLPLASPMRVDGSETQNVLPLVYTIFTMPASPLHSSGLGTGNPSRHLLRLTLPTAQYQISTVKDPLTGEWRSAPPRPPWMVELQQEGAIVEVEIRPKLKANDAKADPVRAITVTVDGKEAVVVSEKESLTSLGREELLDDRVSKMAILSRVPDDAEMLPDDLRTPIAVADDLFDPSAIGSSTPDPDSKQLKGTKVTSESSEDTPGTQPETDMSPKSQAPNAASVHGGLLSFLQSYQNPLARFTSGTTLSTATPNGAGSSASAAAPLFPTPPRKLPGGLGDIDATASHANGQTRVYPLSTVLFVALIAFLIGSLLRSLLSPADFIYVATDIGEAEDAGEVIGWREIRRLLEIKYVLGGWDFQVAAVRRH